MPIQPFLHPDKELILCLDMSSNVDDGVAAFIALKWFENVQTRIGHVKVDVSEVGDL